MKKYSWDLDENAEIWRNDTFDTIEECIQAAKSENKLDGMRHKTVYIGENTEFVPFVNVEYILDNMQDQAADELGQIGHDWDAYDHKKQNELDELQESIQQVVSDWMSKYGYYPHMWRVEGIRPYPLGE